MPLSHAEAAERVLASKPINAAEGSLWTSRSDEAGRLYYSLSYAVSQNTMLAEVPKLFIAIVKRGQWRKWVWSGQERSAMTLAEYILRKPTWGLGATLKMAHDWVRRDPEALAIFTEETTGKHGGDRSGKIDNVKLAPATGNSRAYTVTRLKRERDDLYRLVVAGKLSVNAAAQKAGWRKKASSLDQIKKLLPKLTVDGRAELAQILKDWAD